MQKMLIFVYHLKNFDGTEDMGLCRQSHIFYRMQLELLLHPLCVLFKKCLILNKYQNFKKKISKFDGASNFYVQVYYSVLDFHVRNYWKIHKLDWTLANFLNKCIEDKKEKTYPKQLESSFLRQIFVLGKSNLYIYMYVWGISLVGINPKQPKVTWIKGHYSSYVFFGFIYR
jgi:hypothetical protein